MSVTPNYSMGGIDRLRFKVRQFFKTKNPRFFK